jgi:hypothetical protein
MERADAAGKDRRGHASWVDFGAQQAGCLAQVARREELLGMISSGELQFADIRQYTEERTVRHRVSVAVVTGHGIGELVLYG